MSKSFEPRQVEPQALKRWAKDSGVLLGRLGAPWVIAWGLCLPLLVVGVDKAIGEHHLLAFPAFFLMQMIGVFCQPLLQQALDHAAEGHKPGLVAPAALAAHELASNRQWLARRARGQVMGLLFLVSVMVVIALLAMSGADSTTATPTTPHPLNRAGTLMVFLVAVPVFLRTHGLFDFSYWLEVRHGADQQITQMLHDKARAGQGMMSYTGIGLLFEASRPLEENEQAELVEAMWGFSCHPYLGRKIVGDLAVHGRRAATTMPHLLAYMELMKEQFGAFGVSVRRCWPMPSRGRPEVPQAEQSVPMPRHIPKLG